jgi:hypothetical protein
MRLRALLIALLASLTVGHAACAQDPPEVVYERYASALRARDGDSIAQHLSRASREKMLADSAEMRQKLLELIAALLPASIRIVKTDVGAGAASATLELTGASPDDGTPMYGRVNLVKEEGDWKIDRESWSNTQR